MEEGLGILWRNTVLEWMPQSCRVASAPQYPAEDREPWAWKTGPAGLASGL